MLLRLILSGHLEVDRPSDQRSWMIGD